MAILLRYLSSDHHEHKVRKRPCLASSQARSYRVLKKKVRKVMEKNITTLTVEQALGIIEAIYDLAAGPYAGPFDKNLEAIVNFKIIARRVLRALGIERVPDTFVKDMLGYLLDWNAD